MIYLYNLKYLPIKNQFFINYLLIKLIIILKFIIFIYYSFIHFIFIYTFYIIHFILYRGFTPSPFLALSLVLLFVVKLAVFLGTPGSTCASYFLSHNQLDAR